jgi:hypothetical protein
LNCDTFSRDLLPIFMSWFCYAFWLRDSNMYLVFAAFISRGCLLTCLINVVFFQGVHVGSVHSLET